MQSDPNDPPKRGTAMGKISSALVKSNRQKTPSPSSSVEKGFIRRFLPDAKILVVLALFTLLCALAWAALNYPVKSQKKYSTLSLAGVTVVNQDKQAARKKLAVSAKNQKINIIINGTAHSYTASELGVERDYSSLLDSAYGPPDTMINKITDKKADPVLKTYIQRGRLISAIETQLGQYKTAVDASVAVSGASLVVNPSRTGINIDFGQIVDRISKSNMQTNLTITASLTMRDPEILTPAAEAAKKQAAALIAPSYGVSSGTTSKFATTAQKASWLFFTPDKAKHSLGVSLNAKTAAATMNKLAQSFGLPIKDKVTLTSTDGSTAIIDNGQAGIVVDQNSVNQGLDQFQTALAQNQSFTAPIEVTVQPQGERNLGTATGGKFVLVDLADFKAWAINNTTVDHTMLISSGRPGLETPKGHFTILRKVRLITMTGCNRVVGCWTVPNVPNAEFFTGEGHALHGTYWHNRFGQANLSHGCVNLSLSDAAWLYDWTNVGTDVVVV